MTPEAVSLGSRGLRRIPWWWGILLVGNIGRRKNNRGDDADHQGEHNLGDHSGIVATGLTYTFSDAVSRLATYVPYGQAAGAKEKDANPIGSCKSSVTWTHVLDVWLATSA